MTLTGAGYMRSRWSTASSFSSRSTTWPSAWSRPCRSLVHSSGSSMRARRRLTTTTRWCAKSLRPCMRPGSTSASTCGTKAKVRASEKRCTSASPIHYSSPLKWITITIKIAPAAITTCRLKPMTRDGSRCWNFTWSEPLLGMATREDSVMLIV